MVISLIILAWTIKKMKNRIIRNTRLVSTTKNKNDLISYESAIKNSTLVIQSSNASKLPSYDEFMANKPKI